MPIDSTKDIQKQLSQVIKANPNTFRALVAQDIFNRQASGRLFDDITGLKNEQLFGEKTNAIFHNHKTEIREIVKSYRSPWPLEKCSNDFVVAIAYKQLAIEIVSELDFNKEEIHQSKEKSLQKLFEEFAQNRFDIERKIKQKTRDELVQLNAEIERKQLAKKALEGQSPEQIFFPDSER